MPTTVLEPTFLPFGPFRHIVAINLPIPTFVRVISPGEESAPHYTLLLGIVSLVLIIANIQDALLLHIPRIAYSVQHVPNPGNDTSVMGNVGYKK